MQRLQPIALTAEGDNTYKVCFRTDTGELAFIFTVEERPFRTLSWEPEFSKMVNGDPAALVLNKAIFAFHEARNFQYVDESTNTTADARPPE